MGAPGFDDSPLFRLLPSPAPHSVTYIYPYYDNPQFLAYQVARWSLYPQATRMHLRAIIVDDGSPTVPAVDVLRDLAQPFPIRLFRIEVDVRWNWLAARNIGAHHAEDGWLMLTDMDHVVDADVARWLVTGSFNPQWIYRFQRREHTGESIHPHPNSMFLTRGMFWKAGGYDEALSGHYGTDGDWRRRLAATAQVRQLPLELERHEYQGDSSTTAYKRKQPEDAGKKAIIAKRGKDWRPKVLSFPYHEVPL
jgi:hypothetical protein